MDIVNVNSALNAVTSASSLSSYSGAASLKMLDNAIDLNEQMGTNMIKMMENSVTPYLGSNIDISV